MPAPRERHLKDMLEHKRITRIEVESEKDRVDDAIIIGLTLVFEDGNQLRIGSRECVSTDTSLTFTMILHTTEEL